jgi:hypothetical protein
LKVSLLIQKFKSLNFEMYHASVRENCCKNAKLTVIYIFAVAKEFDTIVETRVTRLGEISPTGDYM